MPDQHRLIFQHIDEAGYTNDIDCYLRHGGYEILKKAVAAKPEDAGQAPAAGRAGLVLTEVTPEQRARLKVDHGLVVRNATGAAIPSGIQHGDIILAINDVPTTTVANFEEQLKRNAGKPIALLIKRGSDTLYVPLKLNGG